MNRPAWHLHRSDGIVLALCLLFLTIVLGAAAPGGRRRAREIVCRQNLHCWGDFFHDYLQDNDGRF